MIVLWNWGKSENLLQGRKYSLLSGHPERRWETSEKKGLCFSGQQSLGLNIKILDYILEK